MNIQNVEVALVADDPAPGEGLYNLSQLDKDNDGEIDEEDEACGDLTIHSS